MGWSYEMVTWECHMRWVTGDGHMGLSHGMGHWVIWDGHMGLSHGMGHMGWSYETVTWDGLHGMVTWDCHMGRVTWDGHKENLKKKMCANLHFLQMSTFSKTVIIFNSENDFNICLGGNNS